MSIYNYDTFKINLQAGVDFDHYDRRKLPRLSAEEEKLDYSKFYYQGRCTVPDEELVKVAPGNGMDPALAVTPENIERVLTTERYRVSSGYCVLDNGIGYGCSTSYLPKVTLHMFEWYKKWKVGGNLRYKIWYPGSHIWETATCACEDIGCGPELFQTVSPVTWQETGFLHDPRDIDPAFAGIFGGNAVIRKAGENQEDNPSRAMCMLHYVIKENTGIRFLTNFYIGGHLKDGVLVKQHDTDYGLCLELTRRMAHHALYERRNMNVFLPEVFQTHKNEAEGLWEEQ